MMMTPPPTFDEINEVCGWFDRPSDFRISNTVCHAFQSWKRHCVPETPVYHSPISNYSFEIQCVEFIEEQDRQRREDRKNTLLKYLDGLREQAEIDIRRYLGSIHLNEATFGQEKFNDMVNWRMGRLWELVLRGNE